MDSQHVVYGDVLRHRDDERNLSLNGLFQCSDGTIAGNIDSRSVWLQFVHRSPNAGKDRKSQVLALKSWLDAADNLRPVFNAFFRIECSLTARETLEKDPGVASNLQVVDCVCVADPARGCGSASVHRAGGA